MATLSILSNVAALQTQRQLGNTTRDLGSSFTRLSSGLRINRASEDAAGLAIASGLSTDQRVFNQGIRNVNDGISALAIAQGALTELRDIVIRQMELAEQAANGVYSSAQRQPLHEEANALVDEFNRIVNVTEFNGQKLIDQSLSLMRVQAGYGSNGALSISIGSQLGQNAGTGSFQSVTSYSAVASNSIEQADFNRDGIVDIVEGSNGFVSVFIGVGDGTFKAGVNYGSGVSSPGVVVGDFNGDGLTDVVKCDQGLGTIGILLGNGDGSLKSQVNYNTTYAAPRWISAADLNQDGLLDIMVESQIPSGSTFNILFGNGNGSFGAPSVITAGTSPAEDAAFGDINGDGITDIAVCNYGSSSISLLLGNGNGTFKTQQVVSAGTGASGVVLEDFNSDGNIDIASTAVSQARWGINFGNADGSFSSYQTMATGAGPSDIEAGDINKDGYLDIVIGENSTTSTRIFFGNGNGTFKSGIQSVSTSSNEDLELADINGDGALDVLASDDSGGGFTAQVSATVKVSTEAFIDLRTAAEARASLVTARSRLTAITNELGAIGSYESRFQSAINTLAITKENYAAAASQIMDVDVAGESGQIARRKILQQAGVAILAQANSEPQLALKLLSSI